MLRLAVFVNKCGKDLIPLLHCVTAWFLPHLLRHLT